LGLNRKEVHVLSLKQYSKEQLQEMSWIEVAYQLLNEKKQAVSFKELVAEIISLLNLKEGEATEKMVQFYTDINLDGRFLGLGDNRWGMRVWYPVDQAEEDTITPVKPRKKKAKKAVDDDLEDFEEVEDEDLDFDDFDDIEEDDLLDEDEDLDEADVDEDEDLEEDDLIEDEEDELEIEDEELEDEDLEEDEQDEEDR
jgi:DNA-directed RNA polymerase subunit delta